MAEAVRRDMASPDWLKSSGPLFVFVSKVCLKVIALVTVLGQYRTLIEKHFYLIHY